eukprot:1115712-Pelagomonas_calceolata.AAC.6
MGGVLKVQSPLKLCRQTQLSTLALRDLGGRSLVHSNVLKITEGLQQSCNFQLHAGWSSSSWNTTCLFLQFVEFTRLSHAFWGLLNDVHTYFMFMWWQDLATEEPVRVTWGNLRATEFVHI